jgi:hypothetical protein
MRRNTLSITLVVPAEAGTQKHHWIPAYAGMTRALNRLSERYKL